jgi:hypothetical protein
VARFALDVVKTCGEIIGYERVGIRLFIRPKVFVRFIDIYSGKIPVCVSISYDWFEKDKVDLVNDSHKHNGKLGLAEVIF